MSIDYWFQIVGGLISIAAFIFSIWVWLRSDIKVRELRGVIQSSYDICGSIMWEMTEIPSEDEAVRLKRAERSLGLVSAIHTLTAKYADTASSRRQTDLDALFDRGVLWSTDMLWDLEKSERIREVWFVSPDLEPDTSDTSVGAAVGRNVRRGTRYVYFIPSDIGDADELRDVLLKNAGLTKALRLKHRITVNSIERRSNLDIFHRGNTILFLEEGSALVKAFEEVVLTKISRRGSFWQEHPKSVGEEIRRTLLKHRPNRLELDQVNE